MAYPKKYQFKKGKKKAGGRRKGTPNKFTSLKQSFVDAFIKLQKDKNTQLPTWGKKNIKIFYELISRMLPKEIELTGKNKEPIEIKITDAKSK